MYIQPNTSIYILANIPLGKDYENTVFYKDADTQASAFMSYRKYTLTEYSYQRAQLGTIRVELPYENLYNCNYLMFKNTAFENKWFYAFITGVSYINNDVSELYYELDVLQTWCYDYSFLDSFVERRHSTHDVIYANTQPEGLELGPYYKPSNYKGDTYEMQLPNYYCILASGSTVPSGIPFAMARGNFSSIYSGLYFGVTQSQTEIGTAISAYVNAGLEDEIVAVYQAPAGLTLISSTVAILNTTSRMIDGYSVKNYKLLGWPFRKVNVSNHQGITADYHIEGFENYVPAFSVENSAYPQGQSRIYPIHYQVNASQIDNAIVYANFPTCGFSGDAFKVWWAQNKNNYIATVNAIGRNYDTNMALSQNAYSIAQRSAQASGAQSINSANAALANATASNNTALANAQNSFNTATGNNVINTGAGMIGSALSLNLGGVVSSALSGITNQAQMNANMQNAQSSAATAQSNASNSAATIIGNTQLAMSTAMKNAATSLASSQLSALTAKQNATEALVAKKQDIENLPSSAKGNAMCDSLNAGTGNIGYSLAILTIKAEYAEIIDQYFDLYGYKQNCLYKGDTLDKRLNRRHWSYTKTVGAALKGNMNASDLQTIKGIYDNGITTWDTLEDVGNYELDNSADHIAGDE